MQQQNIIKLINILTFCIIPLGCETQSVLQRGDGNTTTTTMYTPSTTTYYDSHNVITGSRIALVIGNNAYRYTKEIRNAVADARSMSQVLTERGFQVVYREDADRVSMYKAVDEFLRKLSTETVGVVFYAGHGVQINSANYLLPVDLQAEDESDIVRDGLNLGEMLDKMAMQHTKFSLAMIDACRNNPFAIQANGRAIGGLRGLAPATSNAQGIMVVYSAGANQEALDWLNEADNNPNGLFTREFVRVLREPGLPVQDVVNKVKQSVIAQAKSVKHEQTPAIYDQSTGEFIFTAGVRQDRVDPTQVQDLTNQLAIAKQEAERAKADADRLRREKAVLVTESKAPQITQPLTAITPIVTPAVSVSSLPFEPEMVNIPTGCFQMGSPESEKDHKSYESPQHRVCVEAFQMGKYEITRGQFRAFVNANSYNTEAETGDGGCYDWHGSSWEKKKEFNWRNVDFEQNDNHPVVCVSWNDIQKYIEWLNNETGKNYRLPTEAEWEYAARAGTTTARYWGNNHDEACRYANVADKTAESKFNWINVHNCDDGYAVTAPVGQFQPNDFGLYDMLGNVFELNQDKWHSSYAGSPTDGSAWEAGDSNSHLLRGCSWSDLRDYCRSAVRIENHNSNIAFGLRIASVASR